MADDGFNFTPPKWTKGAVFMLIKLYKKWDLLYDHRNHLYFNKLVRANVLESITKSLQKYVPQMTVNEVKGKIHTLRSQYNKEQTKVDEAEKKGEHYIPTSYWYNELTFLKGFYNVKRLKPRSSNNGDDANNMSDTEEHVVNSKRRRVENEEETYIADENSQSETEEPLVTLEQKRMRMVKSSPSESTDPLFSSKQEIEYDESSLSEVDEPSSSKRMKTEENYSDENGNEDVLKVNKNVTLKLSLAEKPATPEQEYESTLTNFFRANIRTIKDKSLQDELASKIMMLVFEYKRKQRELDS